MKYRKLAFLMLVLLPVSACYRLGILPTPTPLPLPTELAKVSLPTGSQPGGLEAVFVSLVSADGGQDHQCHKLYRFYPDGLALYANFACSDAASVAESWPEIDSWFRRENRDIARGDYYTLGDRLWIRIVTYDPVSETTRLRSFQGEYCNDEMVLQEPAERYYTGVPAELTQPVLEYVRLEMTSQRHGTPALTGKTLTPESRNGAACHVAGFEIIKRPSIVLAGGQAEYQIQTDAGESCALQYVDPGGALSQASGAGTITADSRGICRWVWELGDQKGNGTVTVRIDEIIQDFNIEVR